MNGSYLSGEPASSRDLASERQGALGALQHRFLSHPARTGRPCVTLSYAQSIDGSIARKDGTPLRISGEAASAYTHTLRAVHDAILVGIGTVLTDDPQLTTRLVPGRNPRPVVLDSRLRMSPAARLLACADSEPVIATTAACCADSEKRLAEAGACVVRLPATSSAQVDLPALLGFLAERGVRSLMVEGGSSVIASFLRERLVDHLVVTISMQFLAGKPVLPGDGAEYAPGRQLPRIAPAYTFWAGNDLVIHGDPVWM